MVRSLTTGFRAKAVCTFFRDEWDLSTTFIFVTPRRWSSKATPLDVWVTDRKADGKWKDIRVLDGVALEEWLSERTAVAARLARKLGLLPSSGIQSTDQFWEEYAVRFDPMLTENVLLAGREKQAEEIVRQLTDERFRHLWQADSPEEVIAFAVAAIRKAPSEVRKFLESRTLVISSEDTSRDLAGRSDLIFLARAGAVKVAPMLGQRSATIIPLGRDELHRQEATVLERPNSEDLAGALKTMGLDDEQARRLSARSGRSVTVMARLIASGSAPKAEWDGSRRLIPALLAGGWDGGYEADRKILQTLGSVPTYESYEDELRPFLRMQDPPLDRETDTFRMRAPMDAFLHLGHLIGTADLGRLQAAVETVFGERDPRLELTVEERPYAGLRGERLKHSEWLRSGLATTLLLLSAFHRQASISISGVNPERFVTELVANLPGLQTDWKAIASLGHELLPLMEAAPRPLLLALGHLLEGPGDGIRSIFQDREHDVFGSSSAHTAILWALEMLAWDPSHLAEITLLLAKLARVDPGGKLMNRPLNSLRELLLPWHPNTNASLAQRLAALDQIIAQEPEIGWKLTIKLLPEFHGIGSNTPKPRYREAGASGKETVTYGLVAKGYNEIITRVISLADETSDRWVTVIENIASFNQADRTRAVDLLKQVAVNLHEPGRTSVWAALRSLLNRHRAFQDAEWAMDEPDLAPIDSLVKQLQPDDPIVQILWLFEDYHPDIPAESGMARIENIEKARAEAMRELRSRGGIASILQLADRAKLPQFVAGSASSILSELADFVELVDLSVGKSEHLATFSRFISGVARQRFGTQWEEHVRANFQNGKWTVAETVGLVLGWNDVRPTWNFIASLGQEVEQKYWQETSVWVTDADAADLEFAAEKYLGVGRALAGIRALHYKAEHLSSELLFKLLDSAAAEIASFPDRLHQNVSYELDDLFKVLRSRTDVPPIEVARREYAYLPLFGYREVQLTIYRLIAEDPALLVSILCDVFKSELGGTEEPSEERKARAHLGYRLLSDINVVPGVIDGRVDPTALRTWILEVRRLAAVEHRTRMADEYIGRFLAHTPPGTDGAWPDPSVASLLEELASDKIEQGVSMEQFNMRGVTTRGPYEGGEQERILAAKVRNWTQMREQFARTHVLLSRMAEGWEREGAREDEEARKDAMRFE